MPEATNAQMQAYCDQRVRPFAEAVRAVVAAARDHKAAIDDVYARAIGTSLWSDARTDGPPHLLASGGSANPDDIETFNAFATALLGILDATNTTNDAANALAIRTNWAVLVRACVRSISG